MADREPQQKRKKQSVISDFIYSTKFQKLFSSKVEIIWDLQQRKKWWNSFVILSENWKLTLNSHILRVSF